jgi:hypothetical protein
MVALCKALHATPALADILKSDISWGSTPSVLLSLFQKTFFFFLIGQGGHGVT